MLTIHCAKCPTKLWKYDKIGKGAVLRCHKARITRQYEDCPVSGDKIACPKCNQNIAIDKGSFYKMDPKAFRYTGTKRNK